MRRRFVLAAIAALTLGCSSKNDQAAEDADRTMPSIGEIKAIAEEGFIYGLPLVMNYAVINEYSVDLASPQFKAPFNRIKNEARVYTYQDTAVVTPNSDTPYSMLCMDLRAEPLVISVPAVEKRRYYSVQLIDGNVYNFGYIGSRATGNDPGNYLIAGPDWKDATPPGIKKVFHSSTPLASAVFRTQLFNPEDMPNVVKVQAGYHVEPLTAFLRHPPSPPLPKINFLPATTAGIKQHFYEYLDAALQIVPPSEHDKEIRSRLSGIGIGPAKTFEFKDLSPGRKAAVMAGMKQGDEEIDRYLSEGLKNVNGWKIGSLFGDRAFYNGNWLMRAAAAKGGIYGNDAVEATYPMTRTDGVGHELDGSKHNYTLTFPAGQLPPVNAFWSVTMYDGKTQLLIKNPIDRYLINSPMLPGLKKNSDGSLTLYIQKDSPGEAEASNWLPAPNGAIYLVMRLYWPREAPPSILPPGQGTWRPPAVVAAN